MDDESAARVLLKVLKEIEPNADDEIVDRVLFKLTIAYVMTGKWGELNDEQRRAAIKKAIRNQAISDARKRAKRGANIGEEALLNVAAVAASEVEALENAELAEKAEKVISALPAKQKKVLEDFRNGRSVEETGTELGMKPAAVRMARLRVLKEIREQMG